MSFPLLYRDQFMQLSVFRNDFVVKKKLVNYIEQQSKVVSIQAKLLHKP